MWSITRKELRFFLGNGNLFLIAAAFSVVSGLFLWFFDNEYNMFNLGDTSLSSFFFIAPWILMFLLPAITMRLIAEEHQQGTLSWLFSQPIRLIDIILGKFIASIIGLLILLIPTLFYLFTLQHFSLNGIDLGSLLCGYLGVFLLGMLFLGIGIFVSSFSKSQVSAYVVSVFLCFLLFYGFQGLSSYDLLGEIDYYLQQLGISFHYDGFVRGIIDSRDLVYFLLTTIIFLCGSYFSLIQKVQS